MNVGLVDFCKHDGLFGRCEIPSASWLRQVFSSPGRAVGDVARCRVLALLGKQGEVGSARRAVQGRSVIDEVIGDVLGLHKSKVSRLKGNGKGTCNRLEVGRLSRFQQRGRAGTGRRRRGTGKHANPDKGGGRS